MLSDVRPLEVVLGERQQWVVPVYQRHYEWETGEDSQIQRLWEDLKDETLYRLDGSVALPHFIGAIIFSETPNQPFGSVRQRFLVDGQQRITTFQLILTAIREVARIKGEDRLIDVVNTYLRNEEGKGMADPQRETFKLWPSSYDRALYQNIVQNSVNDLREAEPNYFYQNGNLIQNQSPKMLQAYFSLIKAIDDFVDERVREFEDSQTQVLDAVLGGFLSGFQIVVITLDQNDDAQEIFASLNGLGKPLAPFDLIRNDVFLRARGMGEDDQDLFDSRWQEFEKPFWTEMVRQGRFKRMRADHLIAHAVVAETAREANIGKIATEYQRYARERNYPSVAAELDVLLTHAATYREMENQNSDSAVSRLASILRTWDTSTFHPLVLAINASSTDEEQKSRLYDLIESYIVRREICGLTIKNYNKAVVGMVKQIVDHQQDPLPYFEAHLNELSGDAVRMPSGLDLKEAFSRRAAYGAIPRPRLRYILEKLEYAHRNKFDETTLLQGNLTIEHVLPQKWAKFWPLPDGAIAPCESSFDALLIEGYTASEDMKTQMDERQRNVNTLGNLTLLTSALNPAISNGPWTAKKEKIGESLLAINREIARAEDWNESTIQDRAAKMAEIAANIWKENYASHMPS